MTEAFDWEHGVFLGATVASEMTAAQQGGQVGALRFDPFAMLPFCGYNMSDYIQHWLDIGQSTTADKLPRIYFVNWFRKGADGKFLWPGYGENSRVLKWIIERLEGTAEALEAPIGRVPAPGSLDLDGLEVSDEQLTQLMKVDPSEWKSQLPEFESHFEKLGPRLPQAMRAQLESLGARLG